uniref:Uncharacterized protein n=1 Tax=Vespula pensylvanica TaxID=30213 RepID=A0A834NY55_VESPE|nr:hypothetical protein H0235_009268 [Vespula pensylvanica]
MVATEAGGYVTGEKDSKEGSVPDIGSRKNKELEFQSSGCQARSNETSGRRSRMSTRIWLFGGFVRTVKIEDNRCDSQWEPVTFTEANRSKLEEGFSLTMSILLR